MKYLLGADFFISFKSVTVPYCGADGCNTLECTLCQVLCHVLSLSLNITLDGNFYYTQPRGPADYLLVNLNPFKINFIFLN